VAFGLMAFGLVAIGALFLLNAGLRSGDRTLDPTTHVRLQPCPSFDQGGRITSLDAAVDPRTLVCRLSVANPSAAVTLVAMDAAWSSRLAYFFMGPHDRRHAWGAERAGALTLGRRDLGSVAPHDEAHWDLPLQSGKIGLGRRSDRGVIRVVVLLSADGDRVLRHIHRVPVGDLARRPHNLTD
jgi:hypothetical protein